MALDSSAVTASVAICDDGKVTGEFYINAGLTHSQTLMPMVESLLNCSATDISQIEAFAITTGPGSFTGLRIGIGAVKGMAMALDKPCIEVSTLEAIAYPHKLSGAVICSVMDARCNQVYNAVFKSEGGELVRLCDDRAIAISDLLTELKGYGKIILAGDGAKLCFANAREQGLENIYLPLEQQVYQRASSVCMIAQRKAAGGELLSAGKLMPVYLRPSQAEREYQSRINKNV